jgi:NOL1/NOP2/fmu family ribosome biogenesis protein
MYEKKVLKPKIDRNEFAKWYKGRDIDIEKE